MALNIAARDNTGLTLVATIERLADGFFWNDVSVAFESSPTFANKSITLTEGTSEDLRSYTGSVASLGSPGDILIRIHKSTGANTRGVTQTFVFEDDEIEAVNNIYHSDIEFTRDEGNTQDEYTITWFKNAERITSGITSPTVQVIKRVDGTDLVASTAMTQVGSTGSYKYDEATNRVTLGEAVLIVITATIDSVSRSFSRIATRDSS